MAAIKMNLREKPGMTHHLDYPHQMPALRLYNYVRRRFLPLHFSWHVYTIFPNVCKCCHILLLHVYCPSLLCVVAFIISVLAPRSSSSSATARQPQIGQNFFQVWRFILTRKKILTKEESFRLNYQMLISYPIPE